MSEPSCWLFQEILQWLSQCIVRRQMSNYLQFLQYLTWLNRRYQIRGKKYLLMLLLTDQSVALFIHVKGWKNFRHKLIIIPVQPYN